MQSSESYVLVMEMGKNMQAIFVKVDIGMQLQQKFITSILLHS